MGITIFRNSSMWGDKRHNSFSNYTFFFIPAVKALPKEPWRHAIGIVCYSSIDQLQFYHRRIFIFWYLQNHYDFMSSILYCTNKKGKCEKNFFFKCTDQDYPCQHIDQWPRKTRESTTALGTKKKKACVHIKRVKTNRYLTYTLSRKAWNYT